MKQLLKFRRALKSRKPKFTRQDSTKHKSIKRSSWRKPRGTDSKMRLKLKGYKRSPSKGWKSPKAVKGMNRQGFMPVIVFRVVELTKLDPKTNSIIVASDVGTKNKLAIIKSAKEKGFMFDNVRDAEAFIKTVEEKFAGKKKEKEEKSKEKEKKLAERQKAAKEKEAKDKKEKSKDDLAGVVENEEEKIAEDLEAKKEKDKVLTTPQ